VHIGWQALDKIRFLSLTDPSLLGEGETAQLDIRVRTPVSQPCCGPARVHKCGPAVRAWLSGVASSSSQIALDKAAGVLTITDRGIGMTKQQLVDNLGTIAKSGTSAFLESMQKGGDLNLIGQFGVGFYSVYLVADSVEVHSKHNDDPQQWVWSSRADGSFSVAADTGGEALGRGTRIVLHLKEDAQEYAEASKLRSLAVKYSEFMNFPIYMQTEKEVERPVEEEAAEADADVDGEIADDEGETGAAKTVKEVVSEWERLNDNKAIWLRPAGEVSDEEYTAFYKSLTKEFEAPMAHTHFKAEGDVEFKSILFVPQRAEAGLFENYYSRPSGLKLYVRRVFISDEFNELLPKYLSFMKGIVDSDTLPLNVNRESLQQHSSLKTIKKKLVRKALDLLRKLADDGAAKGGEDGEDGDSGTPATPAAASGDYDTFWKNFGKALKLGIIEDASNRVRLAKLLRVTSSQSGGNLTSLEAYVARMQPWQKQIYYLTGDSQEVLEQSPFLERLLSKGAEVLFFTDPIDEYVMQQLTEFEDHPFQSASKEDLKLGDSDEEAKAKEKGLKQRFKPLTAWWKQLLPAADVEAVRVSSRLSTSPCVVVSSKYGWSANMERIMKAQALGDDAKASYMRGRKILEINPGHPTIRQLAAAVAADPQDAAANRVATLLWETALLESGYSLDNTKAFAQRVADLVADTLQVDQAQLDALDAAPEEAPAVEAPKDEL
jgi:heat shock protein beta